MCPIFCLHAWTSTVSPLFVKGTHTAIRCEMPLKIPFRQNIQASRCSPTAMLHWNTDHCAESHRHLKGSARSQQKLFKNKPATVSMAGLGAPAAIGPLHPAAGVLPQWPCFLMVGYKIPAMVRRGVWQVYYTDATPRTQRVIRQQGLLHCGAGRYSSSVTGVGSMSCVEWVYKLPSLTRFQRVLKWAILRWLP